MLLADSGNLLSDPIYYPRLLEDAGSTNFILCRVGILRDVEGVQLALLSRNSCRFAILDESVTLLGPEGPHGLEGVDTDYSEVHEELADSNDLLE